MLTYYVFTPDSVFTLVPGKDSEPIRQTSMSYSYILLIHVNEAIYLLLTLPFFKIQVNHFMARDDSPGANVISKCMLWVRGVVPF